MRYSKYLTCQTRIVLHVGPICCKYSPAVVHFKKLIASPVAHGRLNRFPPEGNLTNSACALLYRGAGRFGVIVGVL